MECLSNFEEVEDGYIYHHPPSSIDHQTNRPGKISGYLTMSSNCDSFIYCPTMSESEISSDNGAVLSRKVGLKQGQIVDERLGAGSEIELMRKRFSKLLLGEDMSGCGNGACTAITISNSITNLYASVFGHNLRLNPLHPAKKMMWKREMDCLLSVCDFILEFFPKSQCLPDESVFEVMSSRPRSDIQINLPALEKLDAMLIDILDSFREAEFWYVEEGKVSQSCSVSFRCGVPTCGKEEKWWVPVPCVPSRRGLSESSRKHLEQKRECANQIHKAAMAINTTILAEIEIPHTYLASLPKSGRKSVGDKIYRCICRRGRFSPDRVLECLKIGSEHMAVELADRVEASMYTWRRKACLFYSESSWQMVKEIVSDSNGKSDKNFVLAERADRLLFCLKQRYPELSQTTLDACKIEHNKDVGKAVLESYSRVLEGLAFNVVALIEDVLVADRSMKAHKGEI